MKRKAFKFMFLTPSIQTLSGNICIELLQNQPKANNFMNISSIHDNIKI